MSRQEKKRRLSSGATRGQNELFRQNNNLVWFFPRNWLWPPQRETPDVEPRELLFRLLIGGWPGDDMEPSAWGDRTDFISFTILYNVVGSSRAALGILPPILAAAAQSFPDLGMLANSSRLLRQKPPHLAGPSLGASAPVETFREPCGCGNEDCGVTMEEGEPQQTLSSAGQLLQLAPRGSWRRSE